MARKKSRRKRSGAAALWVLFVLCAVAAGAGWWMLSPRSNPAPQRVAELTPAPSPTPPPAQEQSQTQPPQTPVPAVTESPTATPSPGEEPTEQPSLPPIPARTPGGSGPRLALIVDDCGQWIDTERGFLALDIPLTMSVLPDVPYTSTIAQEASAAGKGVMLHLPMETLSGLNPGPGKVTTEMTDDQIDAQVEADLAQVPLAKGVNNHEGSKASADRRVMRDVAAVLARHGNLFFIDSMTNSASIAEASALSQGVPSGARDVFLDNKADVAYTVGQLREAEAIARKTGSAIAIGHPRPTTLAAVREMIPELQKSGIQFVLAGELVTAAPR